MTRNARTKKRIRRRAERDDVAYCTARSRPAAPKSVWLGPEVDLPERPGPDQLLRDHVEDWCSQHGDASLGALPGDLSVFLDLPDGFEDATVREFEPDLDTIETRLVRRHASGTLELTGTAEGRLSIEGVMTHTDADDAEDEGWVSIVGTRDERYVEVLLDNEADVELEFTARADLTNRRVKDFAADVNYRGIA